MFAYLHLRLHYCAMLVHAYSVARNIFGSCHNILLNIVISYMRWYLVNMLRRLYANDILEFNLACVRITRIFNSTCLFWPIAFFESSQLDIDIRISRLKFRYLYLIGFPGRRLTLRTVRPISHCIFEFISHHVARPFASIQIVQAQ